MEHSSHSVRLRIPPQCWSWLKSTASAVGSTPDELVSQLAIDMHNQWLETLRKAEERVPDAVSTEELVQLQRKAPEG